MRYLLLKGIWYYKMQQRNEKLKHSLTRVAFWISVSMSYLIALLPRYLRFTKVFVGPLDCLLSRFVVKMLGQLMQLLLIQGKQGVYVFTLVFMVEFWIIYWFAPCLVLYHISCFHSGLQLLGFCVPASSLLWCVILLEFWQVTPLVREPGRLVLTQARIYFQVKIQMLWCRSSKRQYVHL